MSHKLHVHLIESRNDFCFECNYGSVARGSFNEMVRQRSAPVNLLKASNPYTPNKRSLFVMYPYRYKYWNTRVSVSVTVMYMSMNTKYYILKGK